MITIDTNLNRTYGYNKINMSGLSTDVKPVYINDIPDVQDERYSGQLIGNGSEFYEIDTSTTYVFDKTNQSWCVKVTGGGGGGNVLSVNGKIGAVILKAEDIPTNDNRTVQEALDDKDNIQKDILPEAKGELAGHIYQYTGETNNEYTNGYFYKCEYVSIPPTVSVRNVIGPQMKNLVGNGQEAKSKFGDVDQIFNFQLRYEDGNIKWYSKSLGTLSEEELNALGVHYDTEQSVVSIDAATADLGKIEVVDIRDFETFFNGTGQYQFSYNRRIEDGEEMWNELVTNQWFDKLEKVGLFSENTPTAESSLFNLSMIAGTPISGCTIEYIYTSEFEGWKWVQHDTQPVGEDIPDEWESVRNKPFNEIGNTLKVSHGILDVKDNSKKLIITTTDDVEHVYNLQLGKEDM